MLSTLPSITLPPNPPSLVLLLTCCLIIPDSSQAFGTSLLSSHLPLHSSTNSFLQPLTHCFSLSQPERSGLCRSLATTLRIFSGRPIDLRSQISPFATPYSRTLDNASLSSARVVGFSRSCHHSRVTSTTQPLTRGHYPLGNLSTLIASPLRSLLFALCSALANVFSVTLHTARSLMLAALERLLCSVLILVITAGFARASALVCSTLSMVRHFRKPSLGLLTDPISQLSLLFSRASFAQPKSCLLLPLIPPSSRRFPSRHVWLQTSPHTSAQRMTILAIFKLYQEIYRFLQRLLFFFSFQNASTPYTISTQVRNLP